MYYSKKISEITSNKNKSKNLRKDYILVCETIYNSFLFSNKQKALNLNELINKMTMILKGFSYGNNIKLTLLLLEFIQAIMEKVSVLYSNWLKIKEHSTLGKVVIINSEIKIADIIREIENVDEKELII